jgi:hypothetical protein
MKCQSGRTRGPSIPAVLRYERKGESHETPWSGILSVAVAAALVGYAGQTEQLARQTPAGQPPQSITFPNVTTFGGASGRQASELAPPDRLHHGR